MRKRGRKRGVCVCSTWVRIASTDECCVDDGYAIHWMETWFKFDFTQKLTKMKNEKKNATVKNMQEAISKFL